MASHAHDYYGEGIELFNQGKFFESHEAWEEIWKRSTGAEKLFYQGMIQAAVAILHAQRGNRDGARSLYAKASEKLDRLPASHSGIALGEFREALAEFFAHALTSEIIAELPAPPRIRRVKLAQ